MRALYNILFFLFFCLSAPFYFLKMWRRGNWRRGFGQRFGRYDSGLKQALTNRDVLWLHAVSVGEVGICIELIRALETRLPNIKFVVSTTTSTGMGELKSKLPLHISKVYYPIDFPSCVRRALGVIHPSAIVLVEAEIWPNFLWNASRAGIPLFLVNARLSERSYRGYKRFGFLFRPLFSAFAAVGAQNDSDATRLREIGCRADAVNVMGNLKFDAAKLDDRKALDVPGLLRQLAVPSNARILVAGSTHAGEEAILGDQFLRLKKQFQNLFLVLVPRHMERSKAVGEELKTRGVKFVYRTELTASAAFEPGDVECLLVNTTGELKYFYEHAAVIFVGKSLTAEGGQNPIEPGALGKAMVFGPNMQNFAPIAGAFVANGGAVQVPDAPALEQALFDLLANEARRAELGRNALRVVTENQGAVARTADMIVKHLESQRR